MERYRWINAPVITNPNKKVKLGIREGAYNKLMKAISNHAVYVSDPKIVDYKTRFVEFLDDKKMLLDNYLRVYGFSLIGDDKTTYAFRMYAIKCGKCQRKVTYADGIILCEKCEQVKGEFV